MNRSQLRSLVRDYLNEPSAAFWSDATLNNFLNVAVRRVHNRIKSMSRYHFTTRVTFATTANSGYYHLPANCKDLKMVARLDSDGQEIFLDLAPWPHPNQWSESELRGLTTMDGVPSIYWVVGSSLRLLPVPTSALTIRLYYEARLTDLADDQATPDFDEDYHDLAAKWAAIEASTKDEKRRVDLMDLYASRENDLFQDVLHRLPAPSAETESYLQGLI